MSSSSAFPSSPKPSPQLLKPNVSKPNNSTSSTNQACAACKYQRRKCAPDCLLAPYFPHDRHRQFLNAHKLFGVSNITKAIKFLTLPEKDAAMHTIIFQSDARAKDPVGGCYRIIRDLQYQIEHTRNELDLVLHHLALYRQRAHHESRLQIHEPDDISSFSSSCDLNNSLPYNYPLHAQEQHDHHPNHCSPGSAFNGLHEDMRCLQLQDPSTMVNLKQAPAGNFDNECEDMKAREEVSSERHDHLDFEHEGYVDRRKLNMPQLIISS